MTQFMNQLGLIFFLLMISLFGCAKKPDQFFVEKPVTGEGAIVYIYRPDTSSNLIVSPDLLIDGKKKFEIKNKSFVSIKLSAGKHVFSLALTERYDGQHSIELFLADTSVYFLHVDAKMKFKMNALYERSFNIFNVSEAQALTEIAECQNIRKHRKNKVMDLSSDEEEAEKESTSILKNDPKAKFSISKTRNPFLKSD